MPLSAIRYEFINDPPRYKCEKNIKSTYSRVWCFEVNYILNFKIIIFIIFFFNCLKNITNKICKNFLYNIINLSIITC